MRKINEQGYVSFKESISDFFHGLIDFKGITTRRGYLFPMIYYYGILLTGLIWCILFMFINTLNLGASWMAHGRGRSRAISRSNKCVLKRAIE